MPSKSHEPPRFAAPWWARNPHVQTMWGKFLRRPSHTPTRMERWDTPDGDFVDLDWVDGRPDQPIVALFHGLEGCSTSHYAHALMAEVSNQGWRGAVVHFRGCGGTPNRLPRAYHSGDAVELAARLNICGSRARERDPDEPSGGCASW